jgi:hypothetical protein
MRQQTASRGRQTRGRRPHRRDGWQWAVVEEAVVAVSRSPALSTRFLPMCMVRERPQTPLWGPHLRRCQQPPTGT